MKSGKYSKILLGLVRFFTFFMLIAFVVTCSFMLFLNSMKFDLDVLKNKAILTFANVILLTMILWIIDSVRRKLTVERHIRNIIHGLDKITKGDFNVKIDIPKETNNEFGIIIRQINQMTTELAGVETLRTDFIANVSHELKTPLAVIQNYSTMLQSPDLTDEERMEYARAITNSSRSLANLITNILKLNKLENQKIYPESKSYNLSEQLCECLLNFEEVWEEKGLDIETDIDEDIIINADSELLVLVWNNLLSNAIKFTEKGCISVNLKQENSFIIVNISDTGCGMSAETGKHIFEKFYQGDTSHAVKGNGLGLALVKRIIDIVSGEISVQSEIGKGSTFTVKFRRNTNEEM